MTERQAARVQHRARALAQAALATALIACSGGGPGHAEIRRFQLTPSRICSGETVTASWEARESIHDALIIGGRYVEVPLGGPHAEPSVVTSTRFRLDVTGTETNTSSRFATAAVHRPGELLPSWTTSSCSQEFGFNTWLGIVEGDPGFSSRVRAGIVHNTSGRPITVRHGGVSARIGIMGRSEAFIGTSLSGPWLIDGDAWFTEACDTHTNGPLLSFSTEVRC